MNLFPSYYFYQDPDDGELVFSFHGEQPLHALSAVIAEHLNKLCSGQMVWSKNTKRKFYEETDKILRSLQQKNLLYYSEKEKQWIYIDPTLNVPLS